MDKFKDIDEYIDNSPEYARSKLREIRKAIKEAAPSASEAIKYGMPAFVLHKNLVFFAAAKEHIGFYPTPGPIIKFKKELSKYSTSKGSIRFPLDEKLPIALIKKMVKYRVKEIS